jgi:hypothetical protein
MSVAMLNVLPALAGVLALPLGWDARTIGEFSACDSLGALLGTLVAAAALRGPRKRPALLPNIFLGILQPLVRGPRIIRGGSHRG